MMLTIKSKFTAILIILVGYLTLNAQESGFISVDSEVDRSTITIGDLIAYKVVIKHAPDVQVYWPSLGSNLGAFEIRDYQVKEPHNADDLIVEEIEYTISTFDTGAYIIPPIILEYALAGADSVTQQLQTEPLEIYVRSLLPSEDTDILGLKAQAELPRDWRVLALYIALGVGALLLILGLLWYFKFRKTGERLFAKPAPPPRPPHEVALEELAKLEAEKLFENGEVKAYYSRISDILRTYLAGIYHFDALEKTTTQILDHLSTNGQVNQHIPTVESVLDVCDLAKFAKYESNPDESVAAMKNVYGFVETTMPRVAPEKEESESGNGKMDNQDVEQSKKAELETVEKEEAPAE